MDLDTEEKDELRDPLEPLFGSEVDDWEMNEHILALYAELLAEINTCSRFMDLVPRPYSGFGAKSYIRRELRRIVRELVNDKRELYVTCARGVAYKMITRFRMAGRAL